MGLQKEIEELQRKAGSYELLKEEYDGLMDKVNDAIKGLSEIAGKRPSRTRSRAHEIAKAEYDAMKKEDSYFITRESLRKKYPDIRQHELNNILTSISNKENIHKAKDGKFIRLFFHKASKEKDIKFDKISVMG